MSAAILPLSCLFFALCLAVSYFIQQRAELALSPEENTRSKAAWSAHLRWLFIAVGSLGALCFILACWPDHPSWLFQGFLIANLVVVTVFALLDLSRLSRLHLSSAYLRGVWIGQLVYLLGIWAVGYGAFYALESVHHP